LFYFNPFERKVKNQSAETSIELILLHLVVFKNSFEKFAFVCFAVKPIRSVISCFQLVDFLKTLTEFC